MNAPAQVVAVHKFELAGLGVAPFRFIGCTEKRGPIVTWIGGIRHEVGSPGQPMSVCDYCGTGIANECWVVDRNGKQFKVGSDCIAKVGDAGLKRQIAPALRDAQNARTDARIAAATEACGLIPGPDGSDSLAPCAVSFALSALPHPLAYRAALGDTAASYVCWMLRHAGRSGQLRAAKVVEQVVAQLQAEAGQ